MSRILVGGDPDNPPNWCFRMNDEGQPSSCTYVDGQWHRSWDDDGGFGADEPGVPGYFVAFFVLALVAGIGFTIWKVSTARRMARDAGMNEGDATAMTLLSDDGFEATYLASNLRDRTPPPPAATTPQPGTRSTAERLRELQALLEQGLITQDEYAARRQALIDGV